MSDEYRIDRKPTSGERLIGIVASSFLVLFFGAVSVVTREYLSTLSWLALIPIVSGLATLLATFVTYRTVFSEAKKPSATSVRVVNYIFVVVGCLLVVASPFADGTRETISLLAIGLFAVSIGLRNLATH